MQLNKRKIDVLLRLILTFFVFVVCSFALLAPYVVRTYETNKGAFVYPKVITAEVAAQGKLDTSPATVKAKAQAAKEKSPGWLDWLVKPFNYIVTGAFLITLTGMLLAFSGWLLNSSIEYFVVGMGEALQKGSPMGIAITSAWTIIRDIINLTFVFGLIYLAFMTIAQADTRKLKHGIANILIGALLINFSIFFAKAIIDVANVTALEIYTQMTAIPGVQSSGNGDAFVEVGITGFFAERLGVLGLISPSEVWDGNASFLTDAGNTTLVFSIFVSLIFLVTSFVFMAGAILIAIRFVVLVLLIILSPVAFAFAFIPKVNTEEWSRLWWEKMVSQALFAPAYFLMLYIAMRVADASSLSTGTGIINGNLPKFFMGGGGEAIGAFLNFIMIIGFLVAAIIIAKKIGAAGTAMALKLGGRASFGAAAFMGRQTFGRLGNRFAESDRMKDMASRRGVTGFMARRGLGAARTAQKGSYDVRGVGLLSDAAKKYGGIDAGKPHTGGYKQMIDDVKKKEKDYADSLGTVDENDARVKMMKQMEEDSQRTLEREQDELKRQKEEYKKWRKANPAASQQDIDAEYNRTVGAQDDVVKKAKKAAEGAKENVEKEKHRRQIGAVVTKAQLDEHDLTDPAFGNQRALLEQKKGEVKEAIKKAARASDKTIRDAELAKATAFQKQVEDMEKAFEKVVTKEFRGDDVGYAGVLESYASGKMGHVWSATQGRTPSMNNAAVKEIRKAHKGAKKEEKKADNKPAGGGGSSSGGAGGGHGSGGGGGHHP